MSDDEMVEVMFYRRNGSLHLVTKMRRNNLPARVQMNVAVGSPVDMRWFKLGCDLLGLTYDETDPPR